MKSKFKSAAPGIIQLSLLYFLKKILYLNNSLARKFKVLGELADYTLWISTIESNNQKNRGGGGRLRRESLWLQMLRDNPSEPIKVIELGVAWGYITNWFCENGPSRETPEGKKNNKSEVTSVDSFDLFTGLPEAWRNHPKGFFANDGIPPSISDSRVKFHVGYVEEKISELNLTQLTKSKLIILFDLDLYAPTLAAYEFLAPAIKPGDLLYFDEAFDKDERRILEENIEKDFSYKILGSTPLALSIKILSLKK